MEKKKKHDETGHFSHGIECSLNGAWHEYPCLLLSLFRVSDVALPNSILI